MILIKFEKLNIFVAKKEKSQKNHTCKAYYKTFEWYVIDLESKS